MSVSGLGDGSYVRSIRHGGDDVVEKGLRVKGNSSPGTVEGAIGSNGAQLEGSLRDSDGAVVMGAPVRVDPDPLTPYNRFRSRRTTTDQTGHFSLTGLAPGKYRLVGRSRVSGESRPQSSEPQAVTLSENDHQAVEVRLVKTQE